MAIDFNSPTGKLRLLISDVDESNLVLSDDVIAGFLGLYDGGETRPALRRAAADALDAIATSEALIGKVIRTEAGVSTDGAKLADALRKHAAQLRAQATAEEEALAAEDDFFFGVAEFSPHPSPFGYEAAERGWV